jgi:hypothetical protein
VLEKGNYVAEFIIISFLKKISLSGTWKQNNTTIKHLRFLILKPVAKPILINRINKINAPIEIQ